MGRTLDAVMRSLPKERRDRINARYRVLRNEVENLKALRKAAGKAQTEIASTLHISQPSVSKIEKQADMYLSTLRNYVEAVGGDLELIVRFPEQEPIHLSGLGTVLESRPKKSRKPAAAYPRHRKRQRT